jgi:hypothetical protein
MIFQNNLFGGGVPPVGGYYQGGILVYYSGSIQQGLVVSINDLSGSQCSWEKQPYESVTTTNTYGSGQTNTNNILALTNSTPAAELCDAYVYDGFSDWFLPNTNELLKVFDTYNRGLIPGANLRTSLYWTSYSLALTTAQFVDFAVPSSYSGQVGNGFRDTGPSSPGPGCWVRACRYVTF